MLKRLQGQVMNVGGALLARWGAWLGDEALALAGARQAFRGAMQARPEAAALRLKRLRELLDHLHAARGPGRSTSMVAFRDDAAGERGRLRA